MCFRSLRTILTLLVAAVAFLLAFLIERVDQGFILASGQWHMDPVGEVKLAYTRLRRDCGRIQIVPRSVAQSAIDRSEIGAQVRSSIPNPRVALAQNDWLLVETDLANLEPAIFLLRRDAGEYKQVAAYGGTSAPFNNTQAIHEYFAQTALDAPEELIKCYEPVGPPFAE